MSKALMVVGCFAAVVGGTALGWLVAGANWQAAPPQTMMLSPYAAPAAVADKSAPPAAPAPVAKSEVPAPAPPPAADAPAVTAPTEEKKAQPGGRMEPTRAAATDGKKGKSPAGVPDPATISDALAGKGGPKLPDIDIGSVGGIAKRFLDLAIDSDD